MAATKLKAVFAVTFLFVTLFLSLLTTEAKAARVRRQNCPQGTYEHDGRTCCKCEPGFKVKEHCTATSQTECEECVTGKEYQSHATQQTTCEPCTSCSHPNANLEEDKHCTRLRDATCKCKKNHFCPTDKHPCKVCEACLECGPEGIKVACSATNNTICNEKSQDNTTGIAVGITISLLAVVGALAGYFIWKKISGKKSGSEKRNESGPVEAVEIVPLQPKTALPENLAPYIPDIAEVIGWPIMRNLAMSSHIPQGKIDSCEQDNPNNSVERTVALLRCWVEKESKNAAPKLIQYLRDNNQNSKADDIMKKFPGDSELSSK